MLKNFGAKIEQSANHATLTPGNKLSGQKINIPGDISSAAYFIAAAVLCENSEIIIENVGINPTRDGFITALKSMGADIELVNIRDSQGEITADIVCKSSALRAIDLAGRTVPLMIDEISVFAVCAAFAKGTTVIRDASELKVKESNRISVMVSELTKMGVNIMETEDGMIIEGGRPLKGAHVSSYNDHRIAMSLTVAALSAEGETVIYDTHCVNNSFPGFFEVIKSIQ
jgi:3-phosphoshikimate 1-carboxyvinyltransferase